MNEEQLLKDIENDPEKFGEVYEAFYNKIFWYVFRRTTDYDAAKDIVRTTLPITTLTTPVEFFTMAFEKADAGANLLMAWDDIMITLPVKFSEKGSGKKK